ncbi:hypothetical protein C1646_797303, partial [Rhizophagus diaphanus]
HELTFRSLIINNSNRNIVNTNDINFNIAIFTSFNTPIISIQNAPDLHCLLINMVPNFLLQPFKEAKIHKKLLKKLLLSFLFDLHRDIYEQLWKARTAEWKRYKSINGITKSSFLKRPKQHRKKRRIDPDDSQAHDQRRDNLGNLASNFNPNKVNNIITLNLKMEQNLKLYMFQVMPYNARSDNPSESSHVNFLTQSCEFESGSSVQLFT